MTFEEWMKMARHLKTVYTNDKFIPTKEIAEMWFEYLKDIEFVYVRMAVKYWVETSTYFPTIADIKNKALDYREDAMAKYKELKEIFQTCHSWYPTDLTGKDDMNSFMAAIKSERFDDAKNKALRIKSEIMKAEELKKSFKEYVNEISGTERDKRITDTE